MITKSLLIIWIGFLSLSDTNQIYNADTTKPLSELDAIYSDLVSRRDLQITRLHAYAAAGQFPRNTEFPGRLVPYFVDHLGTACAVGHLMRLDGQIPLVDHISSNCNHVRIENVTRGPLVNWIRHSGLTRAECALIQPSYATIEDYRGGRQWQDEQERLRDHFARVEKTLQVQSQRSLGKAMIAKLESDRQQPQSIANNVAALTAALNSPERNVRIAAAHLLASIPPETALRVPRLDALKPNLRDPDLAVRFWTAVAIEQIGSAKRWGEEPSPGDAELHFITLPVFLAVLESDFDDLRLPALIQLANITPESISTSRQLRIVPEIRHAIVDSCRDRDPDVRLCARQVLTTWRWQRAVCESQRTRRHYLADSYDLESLAAETLTLGRPFATPSEAVDMLRIQMAVFDNSGGITFFEPRPKANLPGIVPTKEQASQIVEKNLRWRDDDAARDSEEPNLTTDKVFEDPLYFGVRIVYPNARYSHSTTYFVPRPALFEVLSERPHSWLTTTHSSPGPVWPASPASIVRPSASLKIRLGNASRNNIKSFTEACDLSASFLTSYARLIIDRQCHETPDSMIWIGRIGDLRQYRPRFLEQGGGGASVYGGGGWDFHQLTMKCNRSNGDLELAIEPIPFFLRPQISDVVEPNWTVDELKLMGWKPLRAPDFFGDRLLPPEYHEVAAAFDPEITGISREKTRVKLYRTWSQDKSLPPPSLMYALMYDRAGDRESALQSVRNLSEDGDRDPVALADIARWELSIGERDSAHKHAEAALELWPNHPASIEVLNQMAEPNAAPD